MVYQKDRRCDCDPKNYPKAVAYELSFVDDDKNEERDEDVCSNVNGEIRSIDGNFGASSSRSRGKVTRGNGCACDGSQHQVKRCDCNCKKEQPRKLYSGKKSTLQVNFNLFSYLQHLLLFFWDIFNNIYFFK